MGQPLAKKAAAAKKQPLGAKKHAPNDSISESGETDGETPAKPKAKPKAYEAADGEENAGPSKAAGGKSASEMYQKVSRMWCEWGYLRRSWLLDSPLRLMQQLSQLEHVLKRPDTYIGSVEAITQQMWVFDSEKKSMVNK